MKTRAVAGEVPASLRQRRTEPSLAMSLDPFRLRVAAPPQKPPRSRGGSFTFNLRTGIRHQARGSGSPRVYAAGGSPSTYVPRSRPQKPPRSRGGRITFNLRAGGIRPGAEAPAFTRREDHLQPTSRGHAGSEAPAFTRREDHLQPTCPRTPAQKPPRSRGGRITFNLRTARHQASGSRQRKPPRSRGGRITFNLRTGRRHQAEAAEAPAFTRREDHLQPTNRHQASGIRLEAAEAPAFTRREDHLQPTNRHQASGIRLEAAEAPAFTRREDHLQPTCRSACK